MPSPIAHSAITLLLYPAAQRHGLVPATRGRRVALLFLLLFALCLPDLDFAIGWVFPGTPLGTHAVGMHSIAVGLVGAGVLAGIGTLLCRVSAIKLLGLFGAAIGLHLLMDMVTWGGPGIGLLWPISEMRIRLPLSVFYGVRHSHPGAWHLHLITLISELLFVTLVWAVARWRGPATADRSPETTTA